MKLTLIDIPEYKANAWTAQAMARLTPRYTGVPNSIEIRAKLGRKEQKAHLRLSLTRKADFSSENCLILFVGNSPRILAGPKEGVIVAGTLDAAREFIILNKTLLQKYYSGRISDAKKVLENLRHVKSKKTRLEIEKEALKNTSI